MDRLQRLAKKKLEIDYSKLQYARGWGDDAEQKRYWSRREQLEKTYRKAYMEAIFHGDNEALEKAQSELLAFYIMYGVRHAKKI